MLSKEVYDKFMDGIQKQIDELDAATKKKAEATIQSALNEYQRSILERIAHEQSLAEANRDAGNHNGASYHEMMAGIFKSILDKVGEYKQPVKMIAIVGLATTFMLSIFSPVKMPIRMEY